MPSTLDLPVGLADQGAPADALFDTLYTELHRLARRELARQGPAGPIGVTTLLHEAYLTISGKEGAVFPDRARFMNYAARVMRGLIIDEVRRRRSQKRGGLFEITSIGTDLAANVADAQELIQIGDALDELGKVDPDLARDRRSEVLLRAVLRRDRRHARRVGADRAAQLGEGPHLPASRDRRREADFVRPHAGLSPDRWRAVSPYLDQALDMAARRARRLAGVHRRPRRRPSPPICSALLAEHDAVTSRHFLEQAVPLPRAALTASLEGQTLGAYRSVSRIGQGGMGSVWLAERCDGRFEGRAAVKLLNVALMGRAGEERFRREGNILARLTHPNIAHLIDAGVSPTGQPYLVLEHVDGQSIDRYCDRTCARHRGPPLACSSTCSRLSRTRTPT